MTRTTGFHVETDDLGHTGVCETVGCSFVSAGWPTKAAAGERMSQHLDEHASGEPMPELHNSGIRGSMGEED